MGYKKGSGIPEPLSAKEAEDRNKTYTFLTPAQIMAALHSHDNPGSSKKKKKKKSKKQK